MTGPLTWEAGNELLISHGGERWLAQRIETERKARGWSQAQLAAELARVGMPIHQSAISKIESPSKSDGRRGISIDEAIGFAKAFQIPLGELLLPPDAVVEARFYADITAGAALLERFVTARDQWTDVVDHLAAELESRPELAQSWERTWGNESVARALREMSFNPEALTSRSAQIAAYMAMVNFVQGLRADWEQIDRLRHERSEEWTSQNEHLATRLREVEDELDAARRSLSNARLSSWKQFVEDLAATLDESVLPKEQQLRIVDTLNERLARDE